jgi:hypothetical protein
VPRRSIFGGLNEKINVQPAGQVSGGAVGVVWEVVKGVEVGAITPGQAQRRPGFLCLAKAEESGAALTLATGVNRIR